MQKRNIKLDVNGLILVNKPRGMSSNQALTAIKKKFNLSLLEVMLHKLAKSYDKDRDLLKLE